jgi:hypothetical protein
MYLLVWRLTGNAPAAFLAGLAYAFAPYRVGQLAHVQVLAAFWMPLALLGLHEFVRTRRWWWLVMFAATWILQGAANGYYLVYFTVVAGLWVLWFMAARHRRRDAILVVVAMTLAALPLVPILIRYINAQRTLGLSRNIGEITEFSADIAAPLCAPPALTFWGWLRVACAQEGELFAGAALIAVCVLSVVWGSVRARSAKVRGVDLPQSANQEQSGADRPETQSRWRGLALRAALTVAWMYGLVTVWTIVAGSWRVDLGWLRVSASSADKPATVALTCLLLAGLLSRRFHASVRGGSTATFYLFTAIVCWVLSWGPFPRLFGKTVLYQAPYGWLVQLPGFSALRVPARIWMMVVLCLVVWMGLVVASVLAGRAKRATRIIVAAAAFGLAADGWTTIQTAAIPPSAPTEELSGKIVLTLPVTGPANDIAAVYHAVMQRYQAINGFSGYEPRYYEALRTLAATMDDQLFEPFVSRGDVEVLVRRDDVAMRGFVERQPGRQLISDGEIVHYRLPRRDVSPPPMRIAARFPIHRIEATCSNERSAVIVDFDLATRWECGAQTSDQAITLDLGEPARIGAILHTLGTFGTDFPRYLHIETSLDGQRWTEAWAGSPAAAVLRAAMAAPREARVLIGFPSRTARFVRLRQTGRSELYYWSIAELEILSGE